MAERLRVVVTGIGTVTACGLDEETLWANLIAGRSGIAGGPGQADPCARRSSASTCPRREGRSLK